MSLNYCIFCICIFMSPISWHRTGSTTGPKADPQARLQSRVECLYSHCTGERWCIPVKELIASESRGTCNISNLIHTLPRKGEIRGLVKKQHFWEFFPICGRGVAPNPKTFVISPSHFWHAKFILRC